MSTAQHNDEAFDAALAETACPHCEGRGWIADGANTSALRLALAKVMPIRVHDGRDYAEVFFADGSRHSTQAMTMNPQDWLDIQAAYDAQVQL